MAKRLTLEEMSAVVTGAERVTILDRASWLPDMEYRDGRWIVAMDEFEKRLDKKPLTALLRGARLLPVAAWLRTSDKQADKPRLLEIVEAAEHLSPVVRLHLADFIDRNLNHRRRKRTPSYDISRRTMLMDMAVADVREEIANGSSKEAALARVAQAYSHFGKPKLFNIDQLRAALRKGGTGKGREMKKRRTVPKSK